MLIVLFDIDGTLIRTGGAGKAAMEVALRTAFGVTKINDVVPYSGRTDQAITRDLLSAHDLPTTDANQATLQTAYLAALPACLAKIGGTICPGIPEILNTLHPRSDVVLGLLTGNVKRGAERKLSHFGLWDFFPVGGFGDVHHDRDDVARSAITAVETHTGNRVNAAEIWVIGDTPLDVKCARAIGAKVVAVATGWHPIEELHATGADVVLNDLSNPQDFLGLLK